MKSELVTTAPVNIELHGVDDDELRNMIQETIGLTEATIMKLAALWVEAQRRGMDLSGIKLTIAPFLEAVARGKILPRLVVEMAGQTRALRRVSDLPISLQAALLDGAEVELYQPSTGETLRKSLTKLTFPELSAAIRGGKILSATDQKASIAATPIRTPRKSKTVEVRLAAETYVRLQQAADGMSIEQYIRNLIIKSVS